MRKLKLSTFDKSKIPVMTPSVPKFDLKIENGNLIGLDGDAKPISTLEPKKLSEKELIRINEMKNLITKLRKMTGLGLMDCKRVLNAYDNDIDKAINAIKNGKYRPFL